MIVHVSDTGHGCYMSGGDTLTNSVCEAGNNGDLALETDGSNTLRNDDFMGGTRGAVEAVGRSACACTTATDTLVNVIARSSQSGFDLEANASDDLADAVIDASYSNFATTMTTGSNARDHINTDSTDQSASPAFVYASGDYHEAQGSPTIDAGINDPANGSTDFDGDPRIANGRTDIGADEFDGDPGMKWNYGSGETTNPCVDCASIAAQAAAQNAAYAAAWAKAHPPPSNAFTVLDGPRLICPGKCVAITLRARVPGPGLVSMQQVLGSPAKSSAPGTLRTKTPDPRLFVAPVQTPAFGPGAVALVLRVTMAARTRLAKMGMLKIVLKTRFVPDGGAPALQTTTLDVLGHRLKHTHHKRR